MQLQWCDDMPGYAALYRTAPGGHVGEHAGGFRVNLQLVLQAQAGVVLKVGNVETHYQEGDIVVWEDSCLHSVQHPSSVTGDRIVLSIKMPHPLVVEKHSQMRAQQAARRGSRVSNEHTDL